jgi:hypothetical protein
MPAPKALRYLATALYLIKKLCKYLPLMNETVRPHVPSGNLAAYDQGVIAVQAFCTLLQTIDYSGDNIPVE